MKSHVRPAFRHLLPSVANGEKLTLIIFRFQRDEKGSGVVISSVVKQALARLANTERQRTLALAGSFTIESISALKESGVEAISLHEWGWTDDSYKWIKSQRHRRTIG
jgi:hypothetical protein